MKLLIWFLLKIMIMVLVLIVVLQIPGIVTCFLATPITGFTAAPFAVGDKVFVEGIVHILNQGDGFNSADNKYNFYDVIAYSNTNPAKLVFDASQFVTANPGIAVTAQNSFASVIKKTNYPVSKSHSLQSIYRR